VTSQHMVVVTSRSPFGSRSSPKMSIRSEPFGGHSAKSGASPAPRLDIRSLPTRRNIADDDRSCIPKKSLFIRKYMKRGLQACVRRDAVAFQPLNWLAHIARLGGFRQCFAPVPAHQRVRFHGPHADGRSRPQKGRRRTICFGSTIGCNRRQCAWSLDASFPLASPVSFPARPGSNLALA
jgi:hypothetical protein